MSKNNNDLDVLKRYTGVLLALVFSLLALGVPRVVGRTVAGGGGGRAMESAATGGDAQGGRAMESAATARSQVFTPVPDAKITPHLWHALSDGPTDFMVVLADQADLSYADTLLTKEAKGRFVYETLRAVAERAQAPLRAQLDAESVPYQSFYLINALHVTGDQGLALRLAARADVARIESNPRVRVALPEPSEAEAEVRAPQGVEWNVNLIGAPDVWAQGYTGQGVVVANQDTGFDWDHPALKSQYRGWDGAQVNHNYNWHDAIHDGGGSCGPDSPEPCDDYGHGTHTLGTMVGDDGAGNQVGVAPGARWIGCRNMDQGWGTPATYIECFEFFLAPYPLTGTLVNGRPELAPDVINNSWSCPTYEGCTWSTLQTVVENVRAAGILVVAAAGNEGPGCSTVREPISLYDASYTVGATTASDSIASFSNRGPVSIDGSYRRKPDIVAPGSGVRSARPGGIYGYSSGTSMATPHVVGATALLWSARPDLRGQLTQTESLLNAAAVPLYSTQCGGDEANQVPNNVYGWGRLDIAAVFRPSISGTLQGHVTTSVGQPVADVQLVAQSGITWATSSNSQGYYTLALPPDAYTVTALAPPYTPYVATNVVVTPSHTTTLDIELALCEPLSGAKMTIVPSHPLVSQTVTFMGEVASGTEPVTYAWTLAGGARATGPTVTHTCSARGQYPVTLTVSNCAGSVQITDTVTVGAPEIEVTPGTLSVSLSADEVTSRTVTVRNIGDRSLAWAYTVTPPVEWLTAYLTYTSAMPLTPTAQVGVGLRFDATGRYLWGGTTALQITSSDPHCPTVTLPTTLLVDCMPVSGLSLTPLPAWSLWEGETLTLTAHALTGTLPITYTWAFTDGVRASGSQITRAFPSLYTIARYPFTLTADNPCRLPRSIPQIITVKAWRRLYLPVLMKP